MQRRTLTASPTVNKRDSVESKGAEVGVRGPHLRNRERDFAITSGKNTCLGRYSDQASLRTTLAGLHQECSLRGSMSEGEDEGDAPIESPPEGAMCSEHPERTALVTCPRCGSYACLACWHGAMRRCHACVVRHPGGLVPFEEPTKNMFVGFFATLIQAASPVVSAPAFRHSGVRRAVLFFLLSFVPVALLSGIIPYTALVLFQPNFVVEVEPATTEAMLWADVGRAALVGLVVRLVEWAAIALPFISLTRAYEDRGHPDAPLRALLYRGWLLPAFWLAYSIAIASLERFAWVSMLMAMLPLILLLSSLRAASRMGSGVGPLTALFTVGVPFAMMVFANLLGEAAVRRILPDLGVMAERLEEEYRQRELAPPPQPPPEPAPVPSDVL